jgi:hypothetical protein
VAKPATDWRPRFWAHVDRSSEHWLWTGWVEDGSGKYRPVNGGPTFLAHHVAWELERGSVPAGMHVRHTCGERLCVNPDHLVLTPYIKIVRDQLQRFWAKVEKTDGCWVWTGGKFVRGYGSFRPGRRGDASVRAHRFSWELTNGPIPEGMIVCHRCDNPSCVRPDHLFLGTNQDNTTDARRKGRLRPPRTAFERRSRGEKHWAAKLTWATVAAIRTAASAGQSQRSLARRYGVNRVTIRNVVRGTTWKEKE